RTIPVPWWFNPPSAKLYRHLTLEDTDVVVSSGAKMGTTWIGRLLVGLLHEYDDSGALKPGMLEMRRTVPGRNGQTYPDALHPTREDRARDALGIHGRLPHRPDGEKVLTEVFGDYVFEDLVSQPRPRLFLSHLFGPDHLPLELFDGVREDGTERKGRGRLVVVLRNLKDTMVSLHHFRGTALDGWHGNRHGPGSFRRFVDLDDCPNGYGSAFRWVRDNASAGDLVGPERALVVYYESLIEDCEVQLRRISDFLGLPRLTPAKARAITEACGLERMRASSMRNVGSNCRRGGAGGWRDVEELTDEHWEKFDDAFDKVLGDVDIAQPMRRYMWREVPGMPLVPLRGWDEKTDPSDWPPYMLAGLRDGMIVPRLCCPYGPDGASADHVRPTSQFKSTIRLGRILRVDETLRDGSPRFHLFSAPSCPMALSAAVTRCLLGLDGMLSMDVADGQSGAGWVYLDGAACAPWNTDDGGRAGDTGRKSDGAAPEPFWLHEVYQRADPLCTADVRAPVLWDAETQKIVSNDAWEIVKLMSDAAADLGLCGGPKETVPLLAEEEEGSGVPNLFPERLAMDIDTMYDEIVEPLIRALYQSAFNRLGSGIPGAPERPDGRTHAVALLDRIESSLSSKHRFLLGDRVTGIDIPLACALLQLDVCGWNFFGLQDPKGQEGTISTSGTYPNLKSYVSEMHRLVEPAMDLGGLKEVRRLRLAIEFTQRMFFRSASAG
ncbi:hypothetical protein ACHAWF_014728, partial [Thalassiosira exigua]